jgi:WD40 repeat protein
MTNGVECLTLVGHSSSVNGCAVSHDATMIASVSADGVVKVWRASDGGCQMTLHVDSELLQCAWSTDDESLVVIGAGGIYLFRIVR